MHKKSLIAFFILMGFVGFSQINENPTNNYLEDQIYLGFTYNVLNNRPSTISPNGFSNGIFIGYIKDIPLSEGRNFGLGLGLGYGRNTYFQNLKISEINNTTVFEPVEGTFNRNKFSLHSIEVPFEVRWRTSTATKYKFWRLYSGLKLGYVFASNAKLKQDITTVVRNISEVNKLQYGLTLSVGYGTWNANMYYALNDIFSDAFLSSTGEAIQSREIRIGLIFYIW
ncbi:MAG: PorT family protein [Flavobacteriaceae bacterium]|nr:PorT family protein [Flavobacteriaceae bacterium]